MGRSDAAAAMLLPQRWGAPVFLMVRSKLMRTGILPAIAFLSLFSAGVAEAGDNPDFQYLRPEGVALPQASFGLGVVIDPGFRLAFLTGRTGVNGDGTYPDDFGTPARNALAAVEALLAEADMEWRDVVKINVYLTDRADLPAWKQARDAAIGASRPAGTGVIVKELADPRARVEIDVIAAKKP